MDRRQFRTLMQRPARRVVTAALAIDPLSAALAKEVGFDTVYVGGGALGYQRGVSEALLTASEVADAARAITERVDAAVVVDATTGFGDAVHTWRTMRMMEQTGAVALELEDQLAPKRAHHHKGVDHMISRDEMVGKIEAAVAARTDPDFLIIARCNSFTHDGREDALERLEAYAAAGADLLLAFPRDDGDFRALSEGTTLPLVAMLPTGGRAHDELQRGGYALRLDAFTATLYGYRAIREGYQRLLDGDEVAATVGDVLAELAEIGETINIQTLYEIEARTTERDRPVGARDGR